MSAGAIADAVGAGALLAGALLNLIATIGLLRFPDVLARMHAATKPQVLGLLLILIGLGLRLRSLEDSGTLVLVAVFQMLTTPVAAHMVGRAAYRTGNVRSDVLAFDEFTEGPGTAQRGHRSERLQEMQDGGAAPARGPE